MPRNYERKVLDRRGADEAVAATNLQMGSVGIRRITMPVAADRKRAKEIDPARYGCARLAAQLADQWIEIASGMSRSVVEVHQQALESFLTFVDSTGNSHASLDREPSVVVTMLSEWTKSLLPQYDPASVMPYRMANIVQSQMAAAVADGVISDGVLTAYVQGPSLLPKPVTRPLDEYSSDELKQIVLAARAHVRAARKIRAWAGEMVHAYETDSISALSRHCVAEMLCAAAAGQPVITSPEGSMASQLEHFPAAAWSLYHLSRAGGRRSRVASWCARAVLPAVGDLVAFRLLLLAGTGVSPAEISSLRVSDIEWTDEGVRLQLTKARAGRSQGRFFVGSPTGRGWDVPGVLQTLLDYTEPARALVSEELRDQVWLAVPDRHDAELRFVPRAVMFGTDSGAMTNWIDSVRGVYDLGEISTPHDVRRIRKTKVAERAINLRGSLADIAGDDHTTKVFFAHYAHTTTLRVYSASVISRVQSALVDAVKTGFTAFVGQRSQVPLAALTEALPLEPKQARSLRSGALDMGVADCRDPFDSPFTNKGKLCGSAPLSCLLCQNAVVFTDHLPNILALINTMQTARRTMGPEEWIAVWGPQYDAAQALMASLPETVRDAAQQRAAEAHTDLPVWIGNPE
ncbi:Uncharacterised protein [Mycobacteroides abscessus subsp. bolletii]|nr:Uncharacterised protein [Mycobacteroides abscessus subsp. bolletii]SIJ70156.1 Uncharacterised protein [Mycobacteroides abscessus subsp. bolletii]SIJ71483.1 Uncharacterised protein [Mycobacteroides abscessus subsp. bolletii]SKT27496.1 Uncharacterised protein [Mycobacteroides abscessus subsp. bolletii]SKT33587.1 Uncharacterised protein [Mycobacteroides abscessus subsp. bolletii]